MATTLDPHSFLQVIVLIGAGGASDGGGFGWNGKKIVRIPSNNPELRRLTAAAQSLHAVDQAGAQPRLAELGIAAEAATVAAAKDMGQMLNSGR